MLTDQSSSKLRCGRGHCRIPRAGSQWSATNTPTGPVIMSRNCFFPPLTFPRGPSPALLAPFQIHPQHKAVRGWDNAGVPTEDCSCRGLCKVRSGRVPRPCSGNSPGREQRRQRAARTPVDERVTGKTLSPRSVVYLPAQEPESGCAGAVGSRHTPCKANTGPAARGREGKAGALKQLQDGLGARGGAVLGPAP